MVFKARFEGIVRGLPQGIEPTTTVGAPPECYPYTEQVSYTYDQTDITEPGYWEVNVEIEQDREAEGGSQWGPFTLTITSPGCRGASFVADGSVTFDVFLKKYRLASQVSDGTNSYWIKDIDAREMLEDKQDILTSGTNIKTINNTSLLGSGNISIMALQIIDYSE
jgi:hypothetical protein